MNGVVQQGNVKKLIAVLAAMSCTAAQAFVADVRAYGAKGDGVTDDTAAHIRAGVNSAAVRTSVRSQSSFSPRRRKMPLSFSCPAIPAIRSAMKTFFAWGQYSICVA